MPGLLKVYLKSKNLVFLALHGSFWGLKSLKNLIFQNAKNQPQIIKKLIILIVNWKI